MQVSKNINRYLWEILDCSKEEALEIASTRKDNTLVKTSLQEAFGKSFLLPCLKAGLTKQQRVCLNSFMQRYSIQVIKKYIGLTLSEIINIPMETIRYYLNKPIPILQQAFGVNYDEVINLDKLNNKDYIKLICQIERIEGRILAKKNISIRYNGRFLWEILGVSPEEVKSLEFNEDTNTYQKLVTCFGPYLTDPCNAEEVTDLSSIINLLRDRLKNGQLTIEKRHYTGRTIFDILGITPDIFFQIYPNNKGLKSEQLLQMAFGADLMDTFNDNELSYNLKHNIYAHISILAKKINVYKNNLILSDTYDYDHLVKNTESLYNTDIINYAIQELDEEERLIVAYRLGLEDGLLHTLDEVMSYFNITKEEVTWLWEKGIIHLKLIVLKYLQNIELTKSDKLVLKLIKKGGN